MYIVMVGPECAPAAKAGGLGDVVFGLSRELEIRGNAVEIVLPKYARMRYTDIADLQVSYQDLWVPWQGGAVCCTVWFGHVHGRKCFFIEPHSGADFFGRELLYGYPDDAERFTFFSKAALEFMVKSGKRPDVIHCHDWQTGLVPVLLCEQYRQALPDQRVCYTIHNFCHQGISGPQVLWGPNLDRPEYFLHQDRLGDDTYHRAANLMKGGVVYSNFVATVSPNQAVEEFSTPSQLAQRDPGVVADDVAGAGPQRGQLGDQVVGRVLGEPGADVVGAGQDQCPGLVDCLGPLGTGGALGDH